MPALDLPLNLQPGIGLAGADKYRRGAATPVRADRDKEARGDAVGWLVGWIDVLAVLAVLAVLVVLALEALSASASGRMAPPLVPEASGENSRPRKPSAAVAAAVSMLHTPSNILVSPPGLQVPSIPGSDGVPARLRGTGRLAMLGLLSNAWVCIESNCAKFLKVPSCCCFRYVSCALIAVAAVTAYACC